MTTTRLGVSVPSRVGPMQGIADLARLADDAAFDSVWIIELYRNAFAMLYGAAPSTSRALLATGIATAFTRSPFEAANLAADVDEISGGRALVGLGAGSPELLAAFHSTKIERPVGRMREYVHCLRRAWEYLDTGTTEQFHGSHYQFEPPPANPWGHRTLPRPQIPIYVAGLAPQMTRLAGEIGDGWIGYLTTPDWIRKKTKPLIEEGAARGGRDLSDFDLAVEIICSVHEDRDVAYRRGRIQTGFYVAHPVSAPMIAMAGLEAERDAVLDAMSSKGLAGLAETSDKLVDEFSIVGTPEEARQKLEHFQTEIPHVILHTPYVPPLDAEEGIDAFRSLVKAFSRDRETGRALR